MVADGDDEDDQPEVAIGGSVLTEEQTPQKVSEYDQEIPQSHTAYQPMAPWKGGTEHLQ